jgi:transposase-like protein
LPPRPFQVYIGTDCLDLIVQGERVARSYNKPKTRGHSAKCRAKALAALANGEKVGETARKFKVSQSTLRRWRDGSQQTKPSSAKEQQKREMADELETIAWKLVKAIPEKITKAPLNQLISTLKITRETIQSIRSEPLNRESFPLDLSKMTNEELDQLERLTAHLLGQTQDSATPEFSGAKPESNEEGDPVVPPGVEPAIPVSAIRDN